LRDKPQPSQPPTVAIALEVAGVLCTGFVALVAVVIPGALLMVVAGAGLMLMFAAQYFLWARWMFPIVQRMERDRELREAAAVAATTDQSLPPG
jgi:hypothetical protein